MEEIKLIVEEEDDENKVNLQFGESFIKGDKGDIGPQGVAGPMGPKGEQGKKGDTGPKGEQGLKGDAGKDGTTFIPAVSPDGIISWSNNDGKENPNSVNIKGERGESFKYSDFTPEQLEKLKGPKGDIGPQGVVGPIGPQGEQGPKGEIGPRGEKGEKGEKGIQGAPGQDGFSPSIKIKNNTEAEYILTITNKDNSYDTPNLKDSTASGKILYQNREGITNDFEMNDSISNYNHYEIRFLGANNEPYSTGKLSTETTNRIHLNSFFVDIQGALNVANGRINIDGANVKFDSNRLYKKPYNSGASGGEFTENSSAIKIVEVIGYK